MTTQGKGAILVLALLGLAWAGLRLVADEDEPRPSVQDSPPALRGSVYVFDRVGDVNFSYTIRTNANRPANCTVLAEFLDAEGNLVISDTRADESFPAGDSERTFSDLDEEPVREVASFAADVSRISQSRVTYLDCR